MKGVFVIRNDLTALHVWGDSEDPTSTAEYHGFVGTNSRSLATNFKSPVAAMGAIHRHGLEANCAVVEFK